MKWLLFLTVTLFLATPCYGKDGAVPCPKLPSVKDLTWEYQQGPDFHVCYAKQGDKDLFGVYFGNFPSFHPQQHNSIEQSFVGSQKVNWFPMTRDNKEIIGRQALMAEEKTILFLGKNKRYLSYAHVMISTKLATEIKYVISLLEGLKFGKLGHFVDASNFKKK